MTYLHRDERRQELLEAAVKIALSDGLGAMTVRRVAQEAQTAAGQIHRLFASSSELKAEAFLLSVKQALALVLESGKQENASWSEMLRWCLVAETSNEGRQYKRLWKEAEVMSHQDEIMLASVQAATVEWHKTIESIIVNGVESAEFTCKDNIKDVSWRLLVFSCGMDGIYDLQLQEFSVNNYLRYMDDFIKTNLSMTD
ncbi:TetR family transcriptional regulator [Cronobacter dublinensis]